MPPTGMGQPGMTAHCTTCEADTPTGITRICTMPGCERKHEAKGFCKPHYERQRKYGSPEMQRPTYNMGALERFWLKVEKTDSCWNWIAARSNGYGRFGQQHGHMVLAHRFSYELANGPIPNDLPLDHLCRNRACVNPAHLEPVTNRVNLLRGEGFPATNARKTHCKRGHEFDAVNTYLTKKGQRQCKACRDAASRRRVAKKAA